MKFGISLAMAKSILGADWIEKSRKGEQKSDHKYIWRTPKDSGKGYDYIYEDDQIKNPFEMLLKFFKVTKATVTGLYKTHNIQKDYNATEDQFASHVLEYEAHKDKWDKRFSKFENAKNYQNPKTMEQEKKDDKKNPSDNKKKGMDPIESKSEKTNKNSEPKFKPNNTLMRKIWAIMNPEKAKAVDIAIAKMNAEKSAGVGEKIDRQKAGTDKIIKDFVGRRATIDSKTGITTFTFGDGTVIQRDKKKNIIFDSRYDNVPEVENETPIVETPSEENISRGENLQDDTPVTEENEALYTKFHELIKQEYKEGKEDFFNKWEAFSSKDEKLKQLEKEHDAAIKESYEAEKLAKTGRSHKWDKTSPEWKNYQNLNAKRYETERKLNAYKKELEIKFMQLETEAEKEKNRSDAMLGNQNAKKDGIETDISVPKADDIYTLIKDNFSWKISVKGGNFYDVKNGGSSDPDRTIYVSNQAEGEKVLKNLKKNSLEALQKKSLTSESVTGNIDYDRLITDAEKDKEALIQKAKDMRVKLEEYDKENLAPIDEKLTALSGKNGEVKTQLDELKAQYNRVRLPEKKADLSLKIQKLNSQIAENEKSLKVIRDEWRKVFDESARKGREIRNVEDDDVKNQNIVINFLKKAKEAKGIAVKDITDQDKMKKLYDMLHSTWTGSYNYILGCDKDDVKVGDKLYYVNPYDLTVQECVVKEVDSKGGAYGNEKGVTFVNKVGNGQRYDRTFMSYDWLSASMVHADGSLVGHVRDRSESGITVPVVNNDEYQEYLNRHNAMLGNQNAAGEHNVQPQTDSEMKKEQAEVKESRKKAGLPDIGKNYGERVSALEDSVSYNPNAENYAYKDTGYIAGSQREKVQNALKRKAEMGETVSVEDVDWNALEENSRTAAQLITKDNVIGKIDYQKFKDNGMDSRAAAMIASVYRSIGKEPVDNTPEGRKNFVWAISTLRERLESCKTYKEVFAMMKEIGEEKSGKYNTLLSMDSEYGEIEKRYNELVAAQKDVNHKVINEYYTVKQRFKNEEERTKFWNDFLKKEYPSLKDYKISFGRYRAPYHNLPYIEIDEAKMNEVKAEKNAARASAIKRVELANPMVKAWKQLGDKCFDRLGQPAKSIYDYYNAFNNLDTWKGATTFTSQKDRNYAKYLNWGWEEKDTSKKEKSNIIKGRVKQKFEMIVPDKFERVGGRDVSVESSQDLKKAYNFRDIQVGTWVQTDVASAKWHTDNINAGFADLGDITGIPDNLISMNGRLAIAIGARGVKGAKAHYEPGERVIQINKMKGGGSLGHEWFHAFDNLISEAMNGGDYNEWLTWQGKDQIRMASPAGNNKSGFKQVVANNNDSLNQKVREKFTNLVQAMMEGDTPETNTVEFDGEKWDKCQNFYNLKTKISKYYARTLNKAQSFDEAKAVIDNYYDDKIKREKDYQSRGYTAGTSVEKLTDEKIKSLEFAAIKFANKESGETEYLTGRIVSRYYQDAKKLGNGYWDTPHEMGARAFQCWLNDKLKEQGRKNTYLVGMVDNADYKGVFYPYPTERDRVKINKAFDELFEVIRSENAIRKSIDILDKPVKKSIYKASYRSQVITDGKRFMIRKRINKSIFSN